MPAQCAILYSAEEGNKLANKILDKSLNASGSNPSKRKRQGGDTGSRSTRASTKKNKRPEDIETGATDKVLPSTLSSPNTRSPSDDTGPTGNKKAIPREPSVSSDDTDFTPSSSSEESAEEAQPIPDEPLSPKPAIFGGREVETTPILPPRGRGGRGGRRGRGGSSLVEVRALPQQVTVARARVARVQRPRVVEAPEEYDDDDDVVDEEDEESDEALGEGEFGDYGMEW